MEPILHQMQRQDRDLSKCSAVHYPKTKNSRPEPSTPTCTLTLILSVTEFVSLFEEEEESRIRHWISSRMNLLQVHIRVDHKYAQY